MKLFDARLYQVSLRIFVLLLVVILTYEQLARLTINLLYLAADQMQTQGSFTSARQLLATVRRFGVQHPLLLGKEAYLLAENQESASALSLLQQASNCSPCDESLAAVFNNLAILLPITATQQSGARVLSQPSTDKQVADKQAVASQNKAAAATLLDQVITLQQRSLALNPNSATALYNLGMQQVAKDELQKALTLFEQATQLEYRWAAPRLQKSLLLLQQGAYAAAEMSARQAVALDPQERNTHLALAHALYMQRASLTIILTTLDEALRNLPEDDMIRSYRALVLRELEQREADLPNK